MKARLGVMTYPEIGMIDLYTVRQALDSETIRQIVGPGATEQELHDLYIDGRPGMSIHAIVEDGVFKGTFTFLDRISSSYVGFWIRREDRRRGLGRAAWEALREENGPIFTAECWADNAGARGFLESLGFTLRNLSGEPGGQTAGYVNREAFRSFAA